DASNGLPTGRVNDLRFGDDGVLWAATDGGLVRLTQSHNTTLSMKSGLPCDRLFWTLQALDRSLWLYSSCGLIRIEDRELQAWATGAIRTVRTTLLDVSDYVSLVGDLGGAPGPHGTLSVDGKF